MQRIPELEKLYESISNTPVSIFDLVDKWKDEGYGIALIDVETDKVVTPYIDPSDYPELMLTSSNNGAKSTDGRYYIKFHSGGLENDPNLLNKPPYTGSKTPMATTSKYVAPQSIR